jgi:hypothetical protein
LDSSRFRWDYKKKVNNKRETGIIAKYGASTKELMMFFMTNYIL